MITQVEIDGFKTLQNVVLPLRPFQAFAGPNNAGKSNLFDALRLLSMLPDHDLPEILQSVRGDPFEVFTQTSEEIRVRKMSLAVELLLDPQFQDVFEGIVELKRNWLRYEIDIEIETQERKISNGVQITRESLTAIPSNHRLPFRTSPSFRDALLRFPRRNGPFISSSAAGERLVHTDSEQIGRPRPMLGGVQTSILSAIRDPRNYPHIWAVSNELRRWKFLHLNPAVMRESNPVNGPDHLDSDGRYLAATLNRILRADENAEIEISNWILQLIPGARRFSVRHLRELQQYIIELELKDGRYFSSRVLSDGTLRLLALLALQYDPEHSGVVCLEEPENGIHPRSLRILVALLKSMATDPLRDDIDLVDSDSLRQILTTTHSPQLVDELAPEDLIFVEEVTRLSGAGRPPVQRSLYRPLVPAPMETSKDQPTRERLMDLLQGHDLGELWVDGALGGVP